MNNIRHPIVEGTFYPNTKEKLIDMLGNFIDEFTKEEVISAISPHAGYIFSGKTSGLVYSKIVIPETVILLGPNHQGYGEPFAISNSDYWSTPLGRIKVDKEISEELIIRSRYLKFDDAAHRLEHSIEVQLPFIQYLNPETEIVPITLSGYLNNPAWLEIGKSISDVVKKFNGRKKVLIVASSDMNHYESQQITEEKDKYAIEAILSLNENLLTQRIVEKNISMCGFAPIIVSIVASKELRAKEATLLKHTTSGHKSGDYSQVVGYAGIIIK